MIRSISAMIDHSSSVCANVGLTSWPGLKQCLLWQSRAGWYKLWISVHQKRLDESVSGETALCVSLATIFWRSTGTNDLPVLAPYRLCFALLIDRNRAEFDGIVTSFIWKTVFFSLDRGSNINGGYKNVLSAFVIVGRVSYVSRAPRDNILLVSNLNAY